MFEEIKPYMISPPFSNLPWMHHDQMERERGSFTWEKRRWMIWNYMKTFRPTEQGWRNKIGLRNMGLRNLDFYPYGVIKQHIWRPLTDDIISLVGLKEDDWKFMADYIPFGLRVTLNAGCPNCHEYGVRREDILPFIEKCPVLIVKLPADERLVKVADIAVEAGVKYLHASNTIALPNGKGGESGEHLWHFNTIAVPRLRQRYPDINIIWGGGIGYSDDIKKDIRIATEYGATHFSISTAFLRPRYFLSALKLFKDLPLSDTIPRTTQLYDDIVDEPIEMGQVLSKDSEGRLFPYSSKE